MLVVTLEAVICQIMSDCCESWLIRNLKQVLLSTFIRIYSYVIAHKVVIATIGIWHIACTNNNRLHHPSDHLGCYLLL